MAPCKQSSLFAGIVSDVEKSLVALTLEDLLKFLLGLFGCGEGSVLERKQNRNSTDYPENYCHWVSRHSA